MGLLYLTAVTHPESEEEILPPSSVDGKNAWSSTATPLCIFNMCYLITQKDYFTVRYKHCDLQTITGMFMVYVT